VPRTIITFAVDWFRRADDTTLENSFKHLTGDPLKFALDSSEGKHRENQIHRRSFWFGDIQIGKNLTERNREHMADERPTKPDLQRART
jgi:hypothetical protein